jgi:hypothetical protein
VNLCPSPRIPTSRLILLRLVFLTACFLAAIVLAGCGSGSGQPLTVPPTGELPRAIASAEPALLFNGTGTSSTDVSAVEAIFDTLGVGYATADSGQLDAISEAQLGGYKLLIVPGGNSITIGENLTAETASNIQGAVRDYGLHYMGICAGAFFGGYSTYNGVDLTAGVWFEFYADESKGIHEEAVEISFPNGGPTGLGGPPGPLDMYWQDGPQLSGWGEVVAKFPDGTPAIVEGQFGKGFVIFTGVHPEALANWEQGMSFTTPVAVDLSYAGSLVQAALDGTPLPHF